MVLFFGFLYFVFGMLVLTTLILALIGDGVRVYL